MATYYYDCPDCGTSVELRKRVTVSKRTCSHCGHEITPEGIDQTLIARRAAYEEANRKSNLIIGWAVLPFAVGLATFCLVSFGRVSEYDESRTAYLATGLVLLLVSCYLGFRLITSKRKAA